MAKTTQQPEVECVEKHEYKVVYETKEFLFFSWEKILSKTCLGSELHVCIIDGREPSTVLVNGIEYKK